MPSSTARCSRSPPPARSRSSSAATTRSPGRARPRSPRSAGPGSVGIVHFDAHADTAATDWGVLAGHGTPMRRLIESGAIQGKNFVQVGLRGYWPPVETFRWMQEQGLRYHFMREIEERGAEAVIAQAIDEALDGPEYVYLEPRHRRDRPGHGPGHRHARAGRHADPRGPPGDPPDRGRGRPRAGWTSSRSRHRTTRPRPRPWRPTAPSSRRSARSPSGRPPESRFAGPAWSRPPTASRPAPSADGHND